MDEKTAQGDKQASDQKADQNLPESTPNSQIQSEVKKPQPDDHTAGATKNQEITIGTPI
jgi:hypothetical protein